MQMNVKEEKNKYIDDGGPTTDRRQSDSVLNTLYFPFSAAITKNTKAELFSSFLPSVFPSYTLFLLHRIHHAECDCCCLWFPQSNFTLHIVVIVASPWRAEVVSGWLAIQSGWRVR